MPGWPTKIARMPNIMKTFHSSGTPIGIDDRMPKWKTSMIAAAIPPTHPPCEKNSTIGTSPSTAVEKWAIQRDRRPGRRSSGKSSKNLRLIFGDRQIGLLDIIVAMTKGEMLVQFRRRRAEPDAQEQELGADDHVDAAEQERHRQRAVHLAACGQEDRLVPESDRGEESEDRPDLPRGKDADGGVEFGGRRPNRGLNRAISTTTISAP